MSECQNVYSKITQTLINYNFWIFLWFQSALSVSAYESYQADDHQAEESRVSQVDQRNQNEKKETEGVEVNKIRFTKFI